MFLYHGTTKLNAECVIDYPLAKASTNGFGFYLTNDIEVARQYGSSVVCYEVSNDFTCQLVRPFNYDEEKSYDGRLEFVLSQQEADKLVLNYSINSTIIH